MISMEHLFLQILNMSLMASFVIMAVILLRFPLKKAPKSISYGLWGVVLFRLICPFSVESIFSLLPTAKPLPQEIFITPNTPIIPNVPPAFDQAVNLPTPMPIATANPALDFIFIGSIVWLVGIAALAIYSIISYWRIKRSVRTALLIENRIYECDAISSPFVLGLFRPQIYLPLHLSDNEKAYILKHEQTHMKRLDTFIKPLGYFVLCLHWFNPLCWIAFFLMSKDMELSCDEAVIKTMGNDIKLDYSTSLLTLASKPKILSGSPLAFGESNVNARIKNVLHYKKPAFWVIAAAVIAVVAVSLCLLTNPKEDYRNEPVGTPISNKIMAQIKLDSGFDLQLVLVSGKSFSGETAGFGGNIYEINFQGTYALQVMKEEKVLSTITHKELLPIAFDGDTLNFPGEFEFSMNDYDGDGNPDFSLGQWAGGNANCFLLFCVDDTGKLRILPANNEASNGVLYSSDKSFSAQFRQIGDASFEFLQYDNAIGESIIFTALWNGTSFDITHNEFPPLTLPWAQALAVQDVKSIELLIEPSPMGHRYQKYSADEFAAILKIINQSKGELLAYSETLSGRMQTLYITTKDGQNHTITNAGNTYLIIDGQFYKGDSAALSQWTFKGNAPIPDTFYKEKSNIPIVPVKEGELSPDDFIQAIAQSFQMKEGVARFIIPKQSPAGYDLSQLSVHVSGSMPMGDDGSNMSLHAYEKEDEARNWQLGKEYTEKMFDGDVPDTTLVVLHVSLLEKDNTSSYYNANSS